MDSFVKDPDAVLDYVVDWAAWLGEDMLSASAWAAQDGITVDSSSFEATGAATVWLSGGTVGTTYTVTNHITTAAGRQNDRSIKIKCKNL